MMTTEFVAHAGFIIAVFALIVGCGALWHSRTNRRVLIKILQEKPGEARNILFFETGSDVHGLHKNRKSSC